MFEKKNLHEELENLNNELLKQDIWDDHEKSNKLLIKKNLLEKFIRRYVDLKQQFHDLNDILITTKKISNKTQKVLSLDLDNIIKKKK